MRVSLITATYNSERTLGDTLASVSSQTYFPIEHIFVDGASTDRTLQLIKAYQHEPKVVVSAPDQGIYDAMNKGVALATGDIVGILNSDDVYHDETVIQDVVAQFEKDPQLHILYGDLIYVKNENTSVVVRKWKSRPYHARFFENGNVPPHPTVFLRRSVYELAGGFDLQYQLASDYEFMLRIFKKFNFTSMHLPRMMVRMRLGGATNKSIGNILKGNQEIIKAWKNNGFKLPVTFIPRKLFKRLIQFF